MITCVFKIARFDFNCLKIELNKWDLSFYACSLPQPPQPPMPRLESSSPNFLIKPVQPTCLKPAPLASLTPGFPLYTVPAASVPPWVGKFLLSMPVCLPRWETLFHNCRCAFLGGKNYIFYAVCLPGWENYIFYASVPPWVGNFIWWLASLCPFHIGAPCDKKTKTKPQKEFSSATSFQAVQVALPRPCQWFEAASCRNRNLRLWLSFFLLLLFNKQ